MTKQQTIEIFRNLASLNANMVCRGGGIPTIFAAKDILSDAEQFETDELDGDARNFLQGLFSDTIRDTSEKIAIATQKLRQSILADAHDRISAHKAHLTQIREICESALAQIAK